MVHAKLTHFNFLIFWKNMNENVFLANMFPFQCLLY